MSQQLVEVMKQIAVNAVESKKPAEVRFGTVLSVSPLQIKLSQKEIYTKEFFIALEGPASCGGACHGSCPDARPSGCPAIWKADDTLVLLRLQGGQQFLILGKKGEVP